MNYNAVPSKNANPASLRRERHNAEYSAMKDSDSSGYGAESFTFASAL
jgi:hypothetical protein